MENNPENFDELRRLLALKKHEEPPPRFFNELSGNVRAQIAREEAERPVAWWQALVEYLQAKPAMAVTYAVAIGAIAIIAAPTLNPEVQNNPALADHDANFNPLAPTQLNSTSAPPAGIFSPADGTVQVGFETNRPSR
ncbi:MAG: hypothetical protein ACKVHO_08895 [Verrucomicrobiia bacterium]|jgi:hypothetical protein